MAGRTGLSLPARAGSAGEPSTSGRDAHQSTRSSKEDSRESSQECEAGGVVQELVALCGGALDEGALRYLLTRKFAGEAEALATWLLDAALRELQAAQAEWEDVRGRESREAEEARMLRVRCRCNSS